MGLAMLALASLVLAVPAGVLLLALWLDWILRRGWDAVAPHTAHAARIARALTPPGFGEGPRA